MVNIFALSQRTPGWEEKEKRNENLCKKSNENFLWKKWKSSEFVLDEILAFCILW